MAQNWQVQGIVCHGHLELIVFPYDISMSLGAVFQHSLSPRHFGSIHMTHIATMSQSMIHIGTYVRTQRTSEDAVYIRILSLYFRCTCEVLSNKYFKHENTEGIIVWLVGKWLHGLVGNVVWLRFCRADGSVRSC